MIIKNPRLLREFRRAVRCEHCKRPMLYGCDPHHHKPKGMGGGSCLDIRINLISLCRECHDDVGQGIPECTILLLIAVREGALQDDIDAVRNLILRLPKDARPWQLDREREGLNVAQQKLLDRTLKETTR